MKQSVPPARPGPRPSVVAAAGYALYGAVWLGFVLHTSPSPTAGGAGRLFGKYSVGYAIVLGLLSIPLVAMPWLARALTRPTRIRRADGGETIIAGWRKVWIVLGTALLSVAVGVGLAETAFALPGLFRRTRGSGRPWDAAVFVESVPRWEARNNAWGWSGPVMRPAKPPNTYRIFVLGGSTTYLQHLDTRENFCSRLQASLHAARGRWHIEVVNASMDGHSSIQSLVKYATLIQDFDPDAVVVMHAINDATHGQLDLLEGARPFERDYGHDTWMLDEYARQSGFGRPRGSLAARSRVLRRLVPVLRGTFYSDLRRGRAWRGDEARLREAERITLRSLPAFRRNLRTLGQLVRRRGAAFVVVSQPTMMRPEAGVDAFPWLMPRDARAPPWADRPDIHARAWMDAMRRYNDTGREVAAELGAHFVDLESAVPAEWANFDPDADDCIHMSAAGCALAAGALSEAILPLIAQEPPR